ARQPVPGARTFHFKAHYSSSTQRPRRPPPIPPDLMDHALSSEFADRFEAERTVWTRKRFLWLCFILGAVMSFSAASNTITLLQSPGPGASVTSEEAAALRGTTLDLVGD